MAARSFTLQSVVQTCRGVKVVVSEASPAYLKLTELYIISNLIEAALEDSCKSVRFALEIAQSEIKHAIRIQEGLAK
jgi:hypothetical protein